jgi:glycosyltransferase involved in cell wall biosynthesis
VFAGRFAEGDPKNAIRFVQAIPSIHRAASNAGVPALRFFLLGNGVLERDIRSILSHPDYRDIDITVRFEQSPDDVLKHSKVFVSIQKESNYPSKSLLEAIACGNLPVVTDVGETRLIAAPEFSEYVSGNVSSEDLAAAIVKLLSLDSANLSARIDFARAFIRQRFDISAHYQHYLRLYDISDGGGAVSIDSHGC